VVVWPLRGTPDFGRFYGSRGGEVGGAALAKNLPQRSRANEFTDGRVGTSLRIKDSVRTACPLRVGRVKPRVQRNEWVTQTTGEKAAKDLGAFGAWREVPLDPATLSAGPLALLETSQDFGSGISGRAITGIAPVFLQIPCSLAETTQTGLDGLMKIEAEFAKVRIFKLVFPGRRSIIAADMRRDMDLIRMMLREYEDEEPKPDLSGYTVKQLLYHAQLMEEAGLIIATFIKDGDGSLCNANVERLTNDGHDLLEASRNDTVWTKFKQAALKVGGGVSIPVATELLKSIVKTQIGF